MSDNGKTKFDYEIEEFECAFHDKRDKKIAIYGTGRMTATLLGRIDGFQIIGLLDRDESLIGQRQYGVEIISREKAETNADIIIINTAENYWRTIYNRIKSWNLPIYFRNGELAVSDTEEYDTEDDYFNKSYDELKQKIAQYDVVSFDIFDTLIMRKIYLPSDLFGLVDKNIKTLLDLNVNFAELRRKAAALLDNPHLDEIYLKMQEASGWSETLTNQVKKIEWETDKKLITTREIMVKLCEETIKEKEVYLISDMYYPARLLRQILHENGLDVRESQIIVSCDYKKSKEDGKLWEYYRDDIVCGRRALHIGDSEKYDYMIPREYGVDTYFIRNANEMMAKSSLKEIVPQISSLSASLAIGLIKTKIFNSPFIDAKKGKTIRFHDEKEAGYCLMGCLCYSFMHWLMYNAREDGVEKIAFFAREGYLLIEQYKYMCSLLNKKKFPDAVYMEISRRAVINAAIETKEDIYEAASFPYTGSLKDFLWARFRVKDTDPKVGVNMDAVPVTDIQKDKDTLKKVLDKYLDRIYEVAREERTGYLNYLANLDLQSRIGIVDSLLYGNTQYYLGKLTKQKMKGYYFCACMEAGNKCYKHQDMKGCFQDKNDVTGKDSKVWKNSNFIEAFFTSPKGMLICMNPDGEGQYAHPMSNQKAFEVRLDMQEGILAFMKDMLEIQKELSFGELCNDTVFAERLFGCFMDGGFDPSGKMKQSFFYDNGILNDREVPIWE